MIFFSTLCNAKVNYISIHEIESSPRKPFSAKLNIVEKNLKSQLKFTLITQNKETLLEYKRLNKYMLRLKSPISIIGSASIVVYEFEQGIWEKTHSLDISNSLVATKIEKNTFKEKPGITTQCRLIRSPRETLWSIASRYKNDWNLDIFSAMLVIYKSNSNKFTNKHIGQLMNDGDLICPSKQMLAKMGSKDEMKAEFNRLNNH